MVRRLNTQSEQTKTQGDLRHDLSNSAGSLLSFVERFERLTEEIEGLGDDRKELMGEVKSQGFDTKLFRRAIAIRKMGIANYREQDDLLDTYLDTIAKAEKAQVEKSVAEGA